MKVGTAAVGVPGKFRWRSDVVVVAVFGSERDEQAGEKYHVSQIAEADFSRA